MVYAVFRNRLHTVWSAITFLYWHKLKLKAKFVKAVDNIEARSADTAKSTRGQPRVKLHHFTLIGVAQMAPLNDRLSSVHSSQ